LSRSAERAAPGETKRQLVQSLEAEGFDVVGVARAAAPIDLAVRLAAFLGAGWHGRMKWLARRAAWRGDPASLWPEAKSAVVVGLSYAPDADPLPRLARRDRGVISVYAQGADYHDVIKKRLKRAAAKLAHEHRAQVKVFVDTAPVMEKPLAAAAGLGWQGKHTNLVSRTHGSGLFLGVLVTDLDLPPDAPGADHCGSCHACLDVCPTKAFAAPYQLDARRCISYLTIEHDGHIPREHRAAIGNRIYGCDDCLAVCPWNKFAARAREALFHPRPELEAPSLASLAGLDDAGFRHMFSGSPIKRTGRDRFVRNVLIAIGNSDEPSLAPAAEARLADPSALVRAAAVWALWRLLPRSAFAALARERGEGEPDEAVRQEWRLGLGEVP
jgi:epoxyqueuosine reductase